MTVVHFFQSLSLCRGRCGQDEKWFLKSVLIRHIGQQHHCNESPMQDAKAELKSCDEDRKDMSEDLQRVHLAESKVSHEIHSSRCYRDVKGTTSVAIEKTVGQESLVQPSVEQMAAGLRILEMSMREYGSDSDLWRSTAFTDATDKSPSLNTNELAKCFQAIEMTERVPKQILQCRAVARDICFSSLHAIHKFRLLTKVIFRGNCIEEWNFNFGFVIPGSVNTWQQVIEAAPSMIPAEQLSGHVIFETHFYDGDVFLCKSSVRLYYV